MAVNPGPVPMDRPLRPEPLHSAPTRCGQMQACKLLGTWEVPFGMISVVNFLFCLQRTCLAALPSEVPKFPSDPVCEWVGN